MTTTSALSRRYLKVPFEQEPQISLYMPQATDDILSRKTFRTETVMIYTAMTLFRNLYRFLNDLVCVYPSRDLPKMSIKRSYADLRHRTDFRYPKKSCATRPNALLLQRADVPQGQQSSLSTKQSPKKHSDLHKYG
jgi:hypothetical protein